MTEATAQPTDVRVAVRERYGQLAREADSAAVSCCEPSCCGGDGEANISIVEELYETDAVNELPIEVTGISLGCGDPVTLAELEPGLTVLDLGSGGGIDCFLAAKQVGESGHVIGVDMTTNMLEKARANAVKLGAENVEFRLGEIEHMPVADATVDVVISNCVINLSPDKPQVFSEAYRVLRTGGKLAVSDIVTRGELPSAIKEDMDSWAACVAGAWQDKDYVAAIREAGFVDVVIEEKVFDDSTVDGATSQLGLEVDPNTARSLAYSARVTARKPG